MRTTLFAQLPVPSYMTLDRARGGWQKGHARTFYEMPDQEEISNIHFILDKLSNKSWVSLLKLKKELKQKGEVLDHVHPFTFFIGALSPSCSHLFYNLKRRGGMPFNEFLKGALESFHDEKKHGNITENQIQIFSSKTGKSIHEIRHFMNSNDWSGFIKWL